MRRFTLTLLLLGTAAAAAVVAPRLVPTRPEPRELHVIRSAPPPTPNPTTPAPPAPPPGPVPVHVSEIVTIPELSEPTPVLVPVPVLPVDPPDHDPCPACGMG